MPTADPFNPERFDKALAELRAGKKRNHWMWFVFPQLRGLGHSPVSEFYGIGSLDEARAYLENSLLGAPHALHRNGLGKPRHLPA